MKHELVMRYSTPAFNYAILFALAVLLICVPVAGLQVMNVSKSKRTLGCRLFPHFVTHPTLLILSLLTARNWRVSLLFNNDRLRNVRVSTGRLAIYVIFPMAISLVLMLVRSEAFPHQSVLSNGHRPRWECLTAPTADILMWIEYVIFGIVVSVGMCVCYHVRKVPKLWNETRHITYAFLSSIVAGAIAVPAALISPDPFSRFVLISSIIIVGVICVLLCVIIPKFQLAIFARDPHRQTEPFALQRSSSLTRVPHGTQGLVPLVMWPDPNSVENFPHVSL
eukprot:c9168_g1_i1.p1 GENE.c9168_g1_i1~~c9168_g1_i1.p1  ORF type:complete len:280 (-),score=52.79 c9168_g1_i1:846-1685(-)